MLYFNAIVDDFISLMFLFGIMYVMIIPPSTLTCVFPFHPFSYTIIRGALWPVTCFRTWKESCKMLCLLGGIH